MRIAFPGLSFGAPPGGEFTPGSAAPSCTASTAATCAARSSSPPKTARRSLGVAFVLGGALLATAPVGLGAGEVMVSGQQAAAQAQGVIQGRIVDGQSGTPLVAALVTVSTEGGRTVSTVLTNRDGTYRTSVAAGVYTLTVSAIGYGTQAMSTVTVASGASVQADFQAASRAIELNPVVISVGREYEKAISAPARVEVVSAEQIASRPVTTPVDHLRSLPAVDVIQQGVQSTNVVVRGFNNIFSGALHTLTDNRIAGVPSLRVNVLSFVPSTNEDVERMEVVLGPGSALYGPNTANGVLHILTKSPLRSPGTTVSVMGGERDLFSGSVRTSHLVGDNFGVKVSGQYLRATEWEYTDPVEAAERAKFDADPARWRQDLMTAVGVSGEEADRRIARIADRNPDLERWSGEVRADWAVSDDATAVFTVGHSNAARQVEMTGLGAAQVQDWSYTFYQTRLNWQRLFAQVYLNQSNAGTTFLLRNGAPIVDRSRLLVGQLQHGADYGTRQRFTYGMDYLFTDPETEGTINGIYEDEDETSEFGAYLQSETRLTNQLNLVLAGRFDTHSALPDAIFSPRAALVYEPTDGQAFRVTYNRAFSTPSSLNQFLDLGTPFPNEQLARLGYSVRVQGTGTEGFRFRQGDGSFLMRSPFTPTAAGGPAQLLPAQAAAFWQAAVVVAAAGAGVQNPAADPLWGALLQMQPTPADISSNFFNPVTGQVAPLSSLQLPDVEPIRESLQSTIEIGYKGILADRALLAADVWHSRRSQLVTPLTVQTPFVTLNGQEVAQYLVPRLMAGGMPAEQAQAVAAQLATGLAQVPLGAISSADVNANGAQLLSTYTNVDDEIDLWGLDVGATFLIDDSWSVAGSLSFVNDDAFTSDRGQIVTLNAPKQKGTASLSYRNEGLGLNSEARARFSAGFPASSGVYEAIACLPDAPPTASPCVESATLVDMNVSYRIPNLRSTTVQLSVQNILDQSFRSFPGTPEVGRMALLRVRYEF
ncbi:MAG: TonB-dependent receptor [Gemmatimonadales bacterium]|nr:MAG: TonB-dependent receptor [Gemmatimonadales bacterium]